MSCTNTLKKNGMKLTPQRRLILDAIHDANAHLTADDIIHCVQARMPQVHKSTVYRTLELLERTGCVYQSELNGRVIYHHADEGHHHHLVCGKCGKVVECEEGLFAPVEEALTQKYGFTVNLNHLVMNGLCKECRADNDS
jgi:Fur family transcriptional regulator, ferric uptake regulator